MFQGFTSAGHRALSADIATELAAIGARYGLNFTAGGGSVSTSELTIKVVAKTNDPKAASDAFERDARCVRSHSGETLKGSDFGVYFNWSNIRFELVGVKSSRPKYPLDAKCLRTGKIYKLPVGAITAIIAARPAAVIPPMHAPATAAPAAHDQRYANVATF